MAAAIVLARHTDTGSFASYSYFQLTISMLAAYAAMGFGVTASRFFAEARIDGGDNSLPLVGTLWGLSCVLSIAASLIVASVPSSWLSAGVEVPRWLLACGVLGMALDVVPGGAVLGLEKYRDASMIAAMSGATVLLAAFVAVGSHNIRVGMYGLVAGSLVQACGESFIIARALGWRRLAKGLRFRFTEIPRVLALSGPMFLVSLMSASGGWLVGRIILNGPGGQPQFALFTIGLHWFALALVVPGMLSRVLLPRLVRAGASLSDPGAAQRLVRAAIVMTLLVACTVALAGIVMGPWILRLYGDRYATGTSVVVTFLIAAVASAPANTIGNAIVARDGQWLWLLLTSAWVGVLIVGAYTLRAQGAWGGGATYALAYGTLTTSAFAVARRRALV